MNDLLPPNSTPLERAAAAALAEIERVPVPLRTLGDPDTCPAHLLAYLAWAFSVDRWDEGWPETTKRGVIKASFYVHQRKGTISAMRRIVEPLGYLLRVEEWWQTDPPGTPGTFRLDIWVQESGITEATFTGLERLLDDAKPLTRHLLDLTVKLDSRGALYLGVTSYGGDVLSVYPFAPGPIAIGANAHTGFGQHIIDTVSVTHG